MTTEQTTKTEESQETSKETEVVSETKEEEGGTPEEKLTFTQAELDQYVQEKATPIAQGMKDKELKSVYDELQTHKKKVSSLERQLTDKAEDTKLARLEKKEIEEYGETADVKEFQEARREILKIGRANESKEFELTETATRLQTVELQQNAFEKALKLFLPEDKEFLSEIEAFAQRLLKADTQKEMNLIYEMEEARIKSRAETPKVKKPKPDSSLPTAPGGEDLSKLSPREKIERGLEKLNKK